MVTHQRYRDKVSQMISWGHWFALFNILLSLGLSSRYLFLFDWPGTLTGRVYAIVSWLGHFSFIVFAVYLLIVFPLTFVIVSQRLLRILCVALATAGTTILLFDIQIFSQFNLHLTPQVWDLVINPIDGEMAREWQLMFISIPIIFLVQMLFATWSWQKLRSLSRQTFAKPLAAIFISAFILSHVMYIWADANFYRPITTQRFNYPLSYPMTARKFLDRYGLINLNEYQQRLFQQGSPTAPKLQYPLNPLKYQDQGEGYNLLLLVVDDLNNSEQSDDLPALHAFKQNSVQFNQHYTTGIKDETSQFGLFYGMSASYFDNILTSRHSSVLFEALERQGYQFGLFSTDGFNSPLFRQALLADYSLSAQATNDDKITVQQWQKWVNNLNSPAPWFSYLNIQGTRGKQTESQINTVINTLMEGDKLKNTIVIVTANYNHDPDQTSPDWFKNKRFNRQQMQVPLWIYWPDTPAQQLNKLTGHQDIVATIMQRLLHVTNPADDYTQGEDLFTATRQRPWLITGTNDELIITTETETMFMRHNGQFSLYDTQGNELKTEKPNLIELIKIFTEMKRFNEN